MKFIDNLKSELYKEYFFWSEQKLGWKRPIDPYCIPTHLLRKYLPADAVIIDCGASIGSDSVELSRIFPRGVIHSIEAVPDMYKLLKANTRKYKNITCYEFGLSSVTGRAKMHISSGATLGASSLLPPKTVLNDHPQLFFKDVIEVSTLTLDDWADKNNVTRVDFLWLDMQGSEFEVLKASKKIFNTV
jgi:FkbM family methyltransferase